MITWRGSLRALIYPGGQGYMESPSRWSSSTIQSGSFLCTTGSSIPIRVVTREVRYIHELSLTLEHSMSISNPAAPGLTSPRALRSRVLQTSSTWLVVLEYFK